MPIDHLCYRWESPECRHLHSDWIRVRSHRYEQDLADPDERDRIARDNPRIVALYFDLDANGMVNPLVVAPLEEQGRYFVIIGNQRLACARALGWTELECVVASPFDSRGDDTRLGRDYVPVYWDDQIQVWREH